MTRASEPLRVGLLFRQRNIDPHAAELIRWLLADPAQALVLVGVLAPMSQQSPVPPSGCESIGDTSPAHAGLIRNAVRAIAPIEQSMVRRRYGISGRAQEADVETLVGAEFICVLPRAVASGVLDDAIMQRLENAHLDVLIDWNADLPGALLADLSRCGLLAPRFGNDHRRSLFDGMDEVTRGDAMSRIAIEWTPGAASDPVSIANITCQTLPFWLLNQLQLRRRAGSHVKRLLGELQRDRNAWLERRQITRAAQNDGRSQAGTPGASHRPSAGRLARYVARNGMRLGSMTVARLAGRRDEWKLSLLRAGWRGADFTSAQVLTAPKGHFWADPFLAREHDRTVLFVEDYVYATGIAHIAALEIGADQVRPLGPVLREPFHLSFPFVFKHGDTWYMCPESAASRQIRLYECTGFPMAWQLKTVLMDNVSAADTVLFQRDGRWWMLTNIDPSNTEDHSEELYLFHRESLLEGEWSPHPMNPLRLDADGARNGGLIVEDGGARLFRVAQRQGFKRYGYGSTIYEITQIDAQHYAEREVARIDPTFRKGLSGTHHLSSLGDLTVIDHVQASFRP